MSSTPPVRAQLDCVLARVSEALIGKQDRIRLALAALLAGGHLLLEDIPGVGKTTLATALAQALGLQAHRLQFTSDLLPADLIGASIYQPASSTFRFQPGPIFAQVLLADEIRKALRAQRNVELRIRLLEGLRYEMFSHCEAV